MRRTLASILGALALAGVLTGAFAAPAYADAPDTGLADLLGEPVTAASDIGPLHVGRLPLEQLLG